MRLSDFSFKIWSHTTYLEMRLEENNIGKIMHLKIVIWKL